MCIRDRSQLLQHRHHARVLRLQEVAELLAGEEGVVPAVLVHGLLPLGGVVQFLEEAGQLGALRLGEARRGHDAAPVGEVHVVAGLLEGGRVLEVVHPFGAGHREHPQLAGLDLVQVLADAGDPEADLVAEDRGEQLAAAVEGDVVDRLRLDPGGLRHQHRREVVGPAR